MSEETFICDDCEKELPIKVKVYEFDICNDCLDDYPNKSGYCSVSCRITGNCDQSC